MSRIVVSCLVAMGCLVSCVSRGENPVVPRKEGVKKPVVLFIEAMEPTATTMEWRPKDTVVKVGDVVEWHVKKGTHGVVFMDWATASKILKVDESVSLHIGSQPGFPDSAQGTEAVTVKGDQSRLLVRATVHAIPAAAHDIEFVCTSHKEKMSGKLMFRSDGGNQPR